MYLKLVDFNMDAKFMASCIIIVFSIAGSKYKLIVKNNSIEELCIDSKLDVVHAKSRFLDLETGKVKISYTDKTIRIMDIQEFGSKWSAGIIISKKLVKICDGADILGNKVVEYHYEMKSRNFDSYVEIEYRTRNESLSRFLIEDSHLFLGDLYDNENEYPLLLKKESIYPDGPNVNFITVHDIKEFY